MSSQQFSPVEDGPGSGSDPTEDVNIDAATSPTEGETFGEFLARQPPELAEPDFQPRPIEPPYRRWKNLGKPYEMTSRSGTAGYSPAQISAIDNMISTVDRRPRSFRSKYATEGDPMNKRSQPSSDEQTTEPENADEVTASEPESADEVSASGSGDPNPRWSALEAEVAARHADAAASAKRADSGVRSANAHLDPAEVG